MNKKYTSQTQVLNLICTHTITNPIPQNKVCEITNLDAREVRRAIETLRRAGWLICASYDSNQGGYYLAQSKEEYERFSKSLKNKAVSIFITIQKMGKAAVNLPTQLNLFTE